MQYKLIPHPAALPRHVRSVTVDLTPGNDTIDLSFSVEGADLLTIPSLADAERADELWKTTCFEMFLKPDGVDSYSEFNLSPSRKWAVYGFTDYREGMMNLPVRNDPVIDVAIEQDRLQLNARIDLHGIVDGPVSMGLTAVIEETDGTKSLWALAHPAEDFHDSRGFIGTLG